jgi:hypothetical protein
MRLTEDRQQDAFGAGDPRLMILGFRPRGRGII